MNLKDLPPEVLIVILSFLEVSETCCTIQIVCRDFHHAISNYHYWKVVSELFHSQNFLHGHVEFDLDELYEKNKREWKAVYKYLKENYNFFFDETTILEKARGEVKVSDKGKTVEHVRGKSSTSSSSRGYNWPTVFFNRVLNEKSVLTFSIQRDKNSTCAVWAFLGICEVEDFEFFQQGKIYFGGGTGYRYNNDDNKRKNSVGFYLSDLSFYLDGSIKYGRNRVLNRKIDKNEVFTFKIDVPKREISVYYSEKGLFLQKEKFTAQPPFHCGLNFPMYPGQRFWLVNDPKTLQNK